MKWSAKIVTHKKQKRIAVYFEKKQEYIQRIKQLTDARWSSSMGAWHVPCTEENIRRFRIEEKALLPDKIERIIVFKQWLHSKRYSENTIKTYIEALKSFFVYYNHIPIESISNQDIIVFNNDYILKKQLSASYQNQIVNAVKLFFSTIENKIMDETLIHRPKTPKLLPNVLSKTEVQVILRCTGNIKHKAMLSLIYACGLRRSELLNLKLHDIDSNRKILLVRQAKGNKDRIVPISIKLIELLRAYYNVYTPKNYLFEGQNGGRYSEKSLSSVLKRALVHANIKKPVSLHWLRHSYATHLLESGTDLRYIQVLLGHKSSRTTEIYTHVSTKSIQNIISPFDNLDL